MEDWQRCLAPECQTALLLARDTVARHGGYVITAEDFLLALLDAIPAIAPFMARQGVDLDELVRTIQAEQPIVSEVHNDGQLSSQLTYWLSRAREVTSAAWLEWPQLLRVLAHDCERLQDRAYVAVLELVQRWPNEALPENPQCPQPVPVAMPDLAWQRLAEDVAVALASHPGALLWLRGPAGSGKTTWLHLLLSTPGLECRFLDVRSDTAIRSCHRGVSGPDVCPPNRHKPVLIMDNTSPSALLALIARAGSVLAELLADWSGPILLLSRAQPADARVLRRVGLLVGRDTRVYRTPAISCRQHRAIAGIHQPAIEKRWGIHLTPLALDYAVAYAGEHGLTPGTLLQWLEQAAARLDLFARRGPIRGLALSSQQSALRSQSLLAMARGGNWHGVEQSMDRLERQLADVDTDWQARKQTHSLRSLQVTDLQEEPLPWLAGVASPVHYMSQYEREQGDTSSAGSGNLYS